MKGLADRRTILLAAGTAAVAVILGPASAQPADIAGTVGFEGGQAIPKGEIRIYVDDPAAHDGGRDHAAEARVSSDGGATSVEFTLSPPATSAASPSTRIVARLERSDGWLLARGSAQLEDGSPVHIVLHNVLY
ncbi:hypothetical protein [Rubellimicrobium mesophilum]|uniref:hypothetical protein n=1 Tax=Rubellimicrobium mesophilum TaxID=1123067 RepID=UPI00056AC6D8|nr:hypothetical protein [Rubellimicrobium mesophilum]